MKKLHGKVARQKRYKKNKRRVNQKKLTGKYLQQIVEQRLWQLVAQEYWHYEVSEPTIRDCAKQMCRKESPMTEAEAMTEIFNVTMKER